MSWRKNRRAFAVEVAVIGLVTASSIAACSSPVLDITTGECFNQPSSQEVTTIPTVSCEAAHDAEVIATVVVQQEIRPDDQSLNTFAQEQCLAQFRNYVGIDYSASSLGMTWLLPTMASWKNDNDRTVTCIALAPDGHSLKRSVKDLKE